MTLFDFVNLIGGLALFLFGMDFMGKSLEQQAGSRLQVILRKLTDNPVKGFLLGLAVTAIIQSSSATTVMVVGFVNSGIMLLKQAVGVIIGANVGTTVTAWLLSLTSISGSAWFIQILKPTFFSPILAMIGIFMRFSHKNENLGNVLLGFAVLMFGMEAMSSAVSPLAQSESFMKLMVAFSHPIVGILVGAVMTAILQSSSASVGILQALSSTGTITFATAVPIIMGQNIGTCVTALISSIGANKNAKRAAMVHLYFNILGVAIFSALFYFINYLHPWSFLDASATSVGIAIIHSTFNILATAVMLPLTGMLEKLAILTIPDKKGEDENVIQPLDERLFNTPTMAVAQSRNLTYKMAVIAKNTFMNSLLMVNYYNKSTADMVRTNESLLDQYEDQIGTYLVRLSQQRLNGSDSREVSQLLCVIGDLERIGDHAVNLLYPMQKHVRFSRVARRQLTMITAAVNHILVMTVDAFTSGSLEMARRIEPLEQVIKSDIEQMRLQHVERLKDGKCMVDAGIVLLDILSNVERVSDHCANIASAMIETKNNALEVHEYQRSSREDDAAYREDYHSFQETYRV